MTLNQLESFVVLTQRLSFTQAAEDLFISQPALSRMISALEQELSFKNGINSALVTTILGKIVVKKGSAKEELHLEIHLKFGGPYGVVFDRQTSSFRFNPCL